MTLCDSHILPMRPEKPCSGKCSGACPRQSRVWVLAASEGMAAVYEKDASTALLPVAPREGAFFIQISEMSPFLEAAASAGQFSQLVLVGSPGDIAWMHLSLPERVTQKVAAEIKYPLLPAWFKGNSQSLHHAVDTVLRS